MKNMIKNPHPHSIRLKIWGAILGVTVLVLLCMWFFQVVLLDRFYMAEKKNEILRDTRTVVQTVEEIGLSKDQAVELGNALNEIAFPKNYYVEVITPSGFLYSKGGMEGENSILRYNFGLRQQIIYNMLASGEEYYLEDDLMSVYGNRFYVGATYQEHEGEAYLVMMESALAPVNEAVSTIQKQLILLSVVLIVLATVIAFVLARSLTEPILKISKAAKQVAAGDLQVAVHVKSKDEIGRLSENFNTMVREINKVNTLQRELVANVSHDFRTPLTMIKGYAETIKDLTGDSREKRNQQLDVIIQESDRLNTLANDILDLSKLQSGQLQLQYREFDLAQKLREIMKRYDLLATNEQFQFSLDAPEHVPVFADEVKIEQVIYNIVNNATNHTGPDKKVMVSLEDGPQWATVRVTDTGNGIKPEDMPLIWDRYYKPYKKNDRKGMGTGLGLSIVKGILTAHRFQFGVDSVVGRGSTFWFQVQKVQAAAPGSSKGEKSSSK